MPVSTSECTASLVMAELPVIAAAANFVAATRKFPSRAAMTTRLDSLFAIEVSLAGSDRFAAIPSYGTFLAP